jgi:hypothetical protein
MPTKTGTDVLYRVEHGDNTTEYTDWDVARATLVKQLHQQWTDTKGAPATKTIENNRTSRIDSAIMDAQHGNHLGLGGVRLALLGIDPKSVTQERIDAAQAATDAAREALNAPAPAA